MKLRDFLKFFEHEDLDTEIVIHDSDYNFNSTKSFTVMECFTPHVESKDLCTCYRSEMKEYGDKRVLKIC